MLLATFLLKDLLGEGLRGAVIKECLQPWFLTNWFLECKIERIERKKKKERIRKGDKEVKERIKSTSKHKQDERKRNFIINE